MRTSKWPFMFVLPPVHSHDKKPERRTIQRWRSIWLHPLIEPRTLDRINIDDRARPEINIPRPGRRGKIAA